MRRFTTCCIFLCVALWSAPIQAQETPLRSFYLRASTNAVRATDSFEWPMATDIDAVRPGQRADISLVSYKRRVVPQVAGVVINVSADLLTDPRTGEGYYTARNRVDAAELDRLAGVELYPGMPVDAFILTGRRTALDYLISPITNGLRRTFREE